MGFKFLGTTFTKQMRDASDELTSVAINAEAATAANIDAMIAQADLFFSGVATQQLDPTNVKTTWLNVLSIDPAVPADEACQRELALALGLVDEDGNTFTFSIPCLDPDKVTLLPGSGDYVDTSDVVFNALKTALIGTDLLSPYGVAIDAIQWARIIGRNN